MTNRILPVVSVLAVAAAMLMPAPGSAQCRPEDVFCAELRIGPARQDPPPVVVETPPTVVVQPPTVVVQPAPPPPPPPPQQPPVVIVQPAPQPLPQRVVTVTPVPPPPQVHVEVTRRPRAQLVPDFDLGLHFNAAALFTADVGVGGGQAAFRLRPIRHIAFDAGIGVFGGSSSHYGRGSGDRWEVPIHLDVLFFFNPNHRFQFYTVVGGAISVAEQVVGSYTRSLEYAGGQAGIGLEWRLGRRFALNVDVRGFLRSYIGGGEPEFARYAGGGRIETTNLSGGFLGTVGMTFYLGR